MKRFLNLPSPALVVASLSLIVSLGGISYAATKLPKNSVGAKQIREGAVASSEVKNGSLKAGDFKAGQIPAGPAGPKGAPGAKGAPGVAFGVLVYHTSAEATNESGSQDQVTALCDNGTFAVGGGALLKSSIPGDQEINSSFPSNGAGTDPGTAGWTVVADNTGDSDWPMTAYVVCAPASAIVDKMTKKLAKK